ncbi:BTB/POZ and MATH domain-containing protein 2-like [Aegilops tauschii subsp. strangulata]|uniref:Speckle-type POZ protein-like protein n=2 Tax=Aegilops tauschii TaxID=37682 RepID=A0A453GSQ1_AEGTS|nr:BTB/POZ and MATH domain-containing protein 2-like [Aegilops tauschii subsp. strangulata]
MANNSTSSVNTSISGSSSRCLTECVTTAHNFEVIRFSKLEGKGAGKFISSSTFSVSGYGWNIRVYPDGWKEEDKAAHLSVFLCFCSGATGVKVEYTLSLLEKDGRVSQIASIPNTFWTVGGYWGRDKFIEKSKLKELLSRNGDCFTIRCVLTVMKEPRTEDLGTVIVPVPQSDMHTHFASMLKDGEGVDVTFSVDGQLFNAHRCVLAAQSSVFKAELFGKMKETTMKSIKINDMEPATFEALLHFIYTDLLSCDVDQVVALQHLFVAADRYGLDRLKAICEGKLCQRIDVQTVAITLTLAEQHDAVHLKNACLRFLSSQGVLRAVKETDGFRHLTTSCPSIMMDILDKVAPPS